MIRKAGRVAAWISTAGLRGACAALPFLFVACVSAPTEIVGTFDAAMISAERFRSYSVKVQAAYRADLASAWAREREHIMTAELEKRKGSDGTIEASAVEELLSQEKVTAKRHAEQIAALAIRDQLAGRNWQAFRETAEALRRYLAAGMSAEDRAKLFEVIADSAERMAEHERR